VVLLLASSFMFREPWQENDSGTLKSNAIELPGMIRKLFPIDHPWQNQWGSDTVDSLIRTDNVRSIEFDPIDPLIVLGPYLVYSAAGLPM
jgi:hypothetical protein